MPSEGTMRSDVRSLMLLLALSIGACGDDDTGPVPAPPDGYPFAYATNGCGPTDGPGTRLILTSEAVTELPASVPRVEVTIYRRAADLQGEQFTWAGSSNEGQSARCDAASQCEPATATSIGFRDNTADTVLTGTVSLRFGDGTTVSGGFDAAWKRTGLVCG
jgi:hypothetical protein